MKKLTFLLLTILIVASAGQVQAVSDKANEKATDNPSSEKRNENSIKHSDQVELEDDITPSISVAPSPTKTDDDDENENECEEDAKNHGAFVSCIAKEHNGGEVVRRAAQSSTGKKKHTPSVTPNVTVSPTVSVTPTATPSVTITITPSPTDTPTNEELTAQIKSLIDEIKELLKSLRQAFTN